MKKNITKLCLLITAVFSLAMASCGYEPVFYGIMHDVAPEKATVSGNIISIARCNVDGEEYFFLMGNGYLKYKPASSSQHGDWETYSQIPFKLHHYNYFPPNEGHVGHQILKVISDENNIYLLTATYETDNDYGIVLPEQFYLWARPLSGIFAGTSADWKNIAEGREAELFSTSHNSEVGTLETNFNLYFTNAPESKHRRAFFYSVNQDTGEISYYILKGLDGVEAYSDFSNTVIAGEGTRWNSAFYIGEDLYFSDSQVVTTNETLTQNATYACLAGVNKNNRSTSDLFITDGGQAVKFLTADSTVASLAMTADSLLIGKGSYTSSSTSNGGIDRVLLDADGRPQGQTAEFTNNAKYQFTSSYILMTLLCADPSKPEAEACLYASITFRGSGSSSSASYNNIGLWSYYPERGNWNRE